MLDFGERFSFKIMESFVKFLNHDKMSFNCLDNPAVREFFDLIGFPLYICDFFRKTVLKEIFDVEKKRVNEEIMCKPFVMAFDGSKLAHLGDVMAIDVAVLDKKIFF